MVWALGAVATLAHLDGDARRAFRDRALDAMARVIERDRAVVFDPTDGLYTGEQSFLDWREQTYPGWTAQDVAHIAMSKSLSTNVLHRVLLDAAAALATERGEADARGALAEVVRRAAHGDSRAVLGQRRAAVSRVRHHGARPGAGAPLGPPGHLPRGAPRHRHRR